MNCCCLLVLLLLAALVGAAAYQESDTQLLKRVLQALQEREPVIAKEEEDTAPIEDQEDGDMESVYDEEKEVAMTTWYDNQGREQMVVAIDFIHRLISVFVAEEDTCHVSALTRCEDKEDEKRTKWYNRRPMPNNTRSLLEDKRTKWYNRRPMPNNMRSLPEEDDKPQRNLRDTDLVLQDLTLLPDAMKTYCKSLNWAVETDGEPSTDGDGCWCLVMSDFNICAGGNC